MTLQALPDPINWSERFTRYDSADIEQAAVDYLLMSSGRLKGKAHPAADIMRDLRMDLIDVGAAMLERSGEYFDPLQKRRSVAAATSSGHFSDLLSSWGRVLATAQIDQSARDVRRLTTPVQLPDYRSAAYPLLSTSKLPELNAYDDPSIEMIHVDGKGESIQVKSKTFKLLFSRELVENDDRQIFEASFLAYGAQIGRRMGRDYSAILTTNADLADGVALFASAEGNDLASGGLDVAALEASMDALRSRTTVDGELYNATSKYLLVPSSKEATARALVRSINLDSDTDRLEVIASPWLSDTYSYLVADPAQAPSVVLVTLEGSSGEPVSMLPSAPPRASFENLPNGLRESFDGSAVDVRVAFAVVPVERNIIRNTLA